MTTQIPKRKCAECRTPFQPRRHCDVFCSKDCRKDNHNREYLRGRAVYRVAYHWRKGRGQGDAKGLFQEMCRIIDEWTAEDHERGFPKPPAHVRRDSAFIKTPRQPKPTGGATTQ